MSEKTFKHNMPQLYRLDIRLTFPNGTAFDTEVNPGHTWGMSIERATKAVSEGNQYWQSIGLCHCRARFTPC